MAAAHIALINAAAKQHLETYGCVRYGKSRIWLLDRGWFASFAEFQPSRYSKASYLNVSAHFLWAYEGGLTFDFGHRVGDSVDFESREQFAPLAESMALTALTEIRRIDEKFRLPGDAAHALPKSTRNQRITRYHRAISHALGGEWSEAEKLLASLASRPQEYPEEQELNRQCELLLGLISDHADFISRVEELVSIHRAAIGLPPFSGPLRTGITHEAAAI